GFLVAIAAAGYMLRGLLPTVLDEYHKASEFSPIWGYVYLCVAGASAAAFILLAAWAAWTLVSNSRRKAKSQAAQARTPSQMSPSAKRAEIETHLADSRALADDGTLGREARASIRLAVATVEDKLDSQTLEIVAFGTVSGGKSSVLNALAGRDAFKTEGRGGTTTMRNEIPWPGGDQVVLVDTPGLAEIDNPAREELAKRAARDADLVLFVTDGPLRDFEIRFLETLSAMEK